MLINMVVHYDAPYVLRDSVAISISIVYTDICWYRKHGQTLLCCSRDSVAISNVYTDMLINMVVHYVAPYLTSDFIAISIVYTDIY